MQRAPHYPECHNLTGLVYEAQSNYRSAAASYRLARYAITNLPGSDRKSHMTDISINLARSLSRVTHIISFQYLFLICKGVTLIMCIHTHTIVHVILMQVLLHISLNIF